MRWTGAGYFLPLMFAVSCLIPAPYLHLTGYAPNDLESASAGLYLVCPVAAAFAALRFRGFTRLVGSMRSPRPGVHVVLRAWWPLALGGPAAFCGAMVATARAVPTDRSSWSIVAVAAVTVTACALSGLGVAWSLPSVVAVPAIGIAWFWWVAYVPSDGGLVLQNMDPTFTGCCGIDMQPARVAVLAALAVAGTICVGVCLLMVPRGWARWSRLAVAPLVAAVLVMALVGGGAAARSGSADLNLTSVEPRSTHLICHQTVELELCLWPEVTRRAPEVTRIVGDLNLLLERWGMDNVRAVAQDSRERGALVASFDPRSTNHDMLDSVAIGYVDLLTRCRDGAWGSWWEERSAFLSMALDQSPKSLADEVPPAVMRAARHALALADQDPAGVRRRFLDGLANHRCGER